MGFSSVETISGVEKIAWTSVRRLGRFCDNSRMPNKIAWKSVRRLERFLRQPSALKGFFAFTDVIVPRGL
jgi:hypothetical protein